MNTIIEKIRAEVNRLKPRIRKICGEEVKIPVEKVREKFDTFLSFLSDLEKEEKPTLQEQPVCEDVENASNEYASHIQITDIKKICGADEWLYLFSDLVDAFKAGANWQRNRLLPMVDNICKGCRIQHEKENPVCDGLEEEINRWMGSTNCFPEGVGISPLPKAMEIVEKTARHFYELGKQSKEQPLLPGFENEQPGIPGKDFVPVAWCDALEQYGIWRIERVEHPVSEELEEEITKWFAELDKKYGVTIDFGCADIESTARHFAQWGAEHRGSSEIPNDLEEAAKAYADDTNPTDSFYEAFKEGALWMREQMMDEWLKDRDGCFWDGVEEGKKAMREQMMKEAVEGGIINAGYPTKIELNTFYSKFEHGQKVKIIIVKED